MWILAVCLGPRPLFLGQWQTSSAAHNGNRSQCDIRMDFLRSLTILERTLLWGTELSVTGLKESAWPSVRNIKRRRERRLTEKTSNVPLNAETLTCCPAICWSGRTVRLVPFLLFPPFSFHVKADGCYCACCPRRRMHRTTVRKPAVFRLFCYGSLSLQGKLEAQAHGWSIWEKDRSRAHVSPPVWKR